MKKLWIAFTYVVCIIILIWLIMSWVNIISHNLTDYDYASWNLIAKIIELWR